MCGRLWLQVPFAACVEQWAAEEALADYQSAALGRKTPASKTARFSSFPPYLMVQLKKCGTPNFAVHRSNNCLMGASDGNVHDSPFV